MVLDEKRHMAGIILVAAKGARSEIIKLLKHERASNQQLYIARNEGEGNATERYKSDADLDALEAAIAHIDKAIANIEMVE